MERAHGIDISKWQDTFDPTVNPDDIDFIILRASFGVTTDPKFDEFVAASQAIPIRGAYHYFQSAHPWKAQADHFVSVVEGQGFHFYALDVESTGNERSQKFADDAERWLKYVAKKVDQPLLLYTNPNLYRTWLRPFGDWMKDWPLWIAQYFFEPDRNRTPALPAGVTDWTIWQYSADSPPNEKGAEYGVGSRNIDLDVFNGSVADMRRWLGLNGQSADDQANLEDLMAWVKKKDMVEALLAWAKARGYRAL